MIGRWVNLRSAIGRPDCWNITFLLVGHSTHVLRWVGARTRRSDRLECSVLAWILLLGLQIIHSFDIIGLFCPINFLLYLSFNLIVKEIWHLPSFSSCQPLSPKYHFLPDKTLDLLVLTRGIFRSGDVLGIFWVISWAKHAESSVVEMNYSPSFIITKDLKGEWESLLFL